MIRINNITYRIGGRSLFEEASAVIPSGHRVGIVGRNGTGKTTLLRLITGQIAPESGNIEVGRRMRVSLLEQEAPGTEDSLVDTVLAADTERAALLAESETAQDPNRIAEIHTRLSDIQAHTAPARAGRILAGLGFDAAAQARPCSSFSGGWRARVALAAQLFAAPDILLLDEPTNYLDAEGAVWLESFLARYPHSLLIVSHDRDLLNNSVQGLLHLDELKLTYYAGGYDQFERQRSARLSQQVAMKRKQEREREHIQSFVDRFRYKASKARQAQSRLKALARLQPIAAVADESVKPFVLPNSPELAPPLITIDGLDVGYEPGNPVLHGLNLRIDPDDRIALLGANGNGKSTFVKMLAGQLERERGTLTKSSKLKVGYFAQHQMEELHAADNALDHLGRALPKLRETELRARLAQFGLDVDKVNVKAENLSGGEKARLALALATVNAPHLLILDEPTNHLDIDSREALAQGLNEYGGAVILVTHDRHLIATCADRLWLVANGGIEPYDDDIESYRKSLIMPREGAPATNGAAVPSMTKQERRRAAAQKRESVAPLKRITKAAEKQVREVEKKIEDIDKTLADPKMYETEPGRSQALIKERAEAGRDLAAAEEAWLEAEAVYEAAKKEANL